MPDVTEFRIVLTVADFEEVVAFYRDTLRFAQMADWSSGDGRVVLLDAGRATLEIVDETQAETIDRIEAGRRVSGPVRIALEVADRDATAARLIAAGAEQMAPPVVAPWGDRSVRLREPGGLQLTLFASP